MKTQDRIHPARGLLKSLALAALALAAALPGAARAADFVPPGSTTTTVATGDAYTIANGESFWVGRWNSAGAILNQTGGSITITGDWGNFGIGENPNGWGVYNMSGDAVFSATALNGASGAYSFSIQGYNGSKMTMTDNATANIGSLTFGSYGDWGHVELSGNASLTAGNIGNNDNGYTFGSGYITFASGSLATLTLTGKVLADYQAYVASGNIRLDGDTSDISKFQLSGSTLSLAPVVANPTIVATQSANGTISPSGTNTVASGSDNTYSITPGSGYHVATLTVDDVSVTPPATSYTFVNVTANHTITATFEPGTTVTITATQSANGSITPSGVTTLNYYDNQDYTITPDPGYHVNTLTVDGVPVVPAANYTFSNVWSDHTITASFSNSFNTLNLLVPGTGANIGPDVNGVYTTLSPTGPLNNDVAVQQEFVIGGAPWNGNYGGAGTLDQTGGTITKSGGGRVQIGWACQGTYNMSGTAGFVSPYMTLGQNEGDGLPGTGMWSLTDTAMASIGDLTVGQANTGIGRISLAGSAQLTVNGSISFNTATASYISFAFGSTAQLTIGTQNQAYYEGLYDSGYLRVDGVKPATFAGAFQVTGSTLSLAAGGSSPYAAWAGGHAFDSLNGDGVAYGMAWILGSPTHSSPNSVGLLPTTQASGSELVLHFKRVNAMGTAHLNLELSDDLSPGSWTTSIPVPAVGGSNSGVTFVVTGPDLNGLNDVYAHIPFDGKDKRFARLAATEN